MRPTLRAAKHCAAPRRLPSFWPRPVRDLRGSRPALHIGWAASSTLTSRMRMPLVARSRQRAGSIASGLKPSSAAMCALGSCCWTREPTQPTQANQRQQTSNRLSSPCPPCAPSWRASASPCAARRLSSPMPGCYSSQGPDGPRSSPTGRFTCPKRESRSSPFCVSPAHPWARSKSLTDQEGQLTAAQTDQPVLPFTDSPEPDWPNRFHAPPCQGPLHLLPR